MAAGFKFALMGNTIVVRSTENHTSILSPVKGLRTKTPRNILNDWSSSRIKKKINWTTLSKTILYASLPSIKKQSQLLGIVFLIIGLFILSPAQHARLQSERLLPITPPGSYRD